MTNLLRNGLIGAILVTAFILFTRWSSFQETRQTLENQGEANYTTLTPAGASASSTPSNSDIPDYTVATSDNSDLPQLNVGQTSSTDDSTTGRIISVKTGTLNVSIDTLGGDIIHSSLPKHLEKLGKDDAPLVLLKRTNRHTYVAQSGLIGPNGTDASDTRPLFSSSNTLYTLEEGEEALSVDLRYQQDSVAITKRFIFERDSYLVKIEYLIDNRSTSTWSAALYGQIRRDNYNPTSNSAFTMKPFLGAAITTPETRYKKMDFGDIADETFTAKHQGGWVAMIQHYFVSAWVPDSEQLNSYKISHNTSSGLYIMGYNGELTSVAPGQQGTFSTAFYTGPKNIKSLEKIAPHLDLTIDFSWLWFIAKPLFLLLDSIQDVVGNWGIAIILLTLLIKILFLYPSHISYRSMAKMRKVQPMMAELKERCGEDRQKMSTELMKLYRKEKVNPLSGCLPMLMQMPVFLALYWVLFESVELRHSPFFLWIEDLSVKDPFFVLPLVMGITMFVQQKLNPTPPDPMQAKIMQMMPIFFTFLFMLFPAGLVLYWVVNNTLSIIQQYVITKRIEAEG